MRERRDAGEDRRRLAAPLEVERDEREDVRDDEADERGDRQRQRAVDGAGAGRARARSRTASSARPLPRPDADGGGAGRLVTRDQVAGIASAVSPSAAPPAVSRSSPIRNDRRESPQRAPRRSADARRRSARAAEEGLQALEERPPLALVRQGVEPPGAPLGAHARVGEVVDGVRRPERRAARGCLRVDRIDETAPHPARRPCAPAGRCAPTPRRPRRRDRWSGAARS